jgi:hypothetical protein
MTSAWKVTRIDFGDCGPLRRPSEAGAGLGSTCTRPAGGRSRAPCNPEGFGDRRQQRYLRRDEVVADITGRLPGVTLKHFTGRDVISG